MMFRNLCLALAATASLAAFTAPAIAQQERDVMEVIRAQIATNRQALVADNLGLTAEQSDVFWPIYREFQAERTALVDRRVALLTEFRDNFDMIQDGAALLPDREQAGQHHQLRARPGRPADRVNAAEGFRRPRFGRRGRTRAPLAPVPGPVIQFL